jgi:malate dehydrogenase (oxaloacetate-decarboxylating)
MSDIYKKSLDLHKEKKGKLSMFSKITISDNDDLSLAYTPGVAGVSQAIYSDKSLVNSLTIKGNSVAVVTDGSAVLGLGNLGPESALPVMEGKCVLFKEFAGIDAFPICLNTQDEEEIIQTVKNIAPVFGGINLEDISAPRCFKIEERLKKELDIPVMHDDQHGASTVILAGLINSLKLRNLSKEDAKVVINGAGAAGIASVKIMLDYGFKNIIVCDSKGVICENRGDLTEIKDWIAKNTNSNQEKGNLSDVIKGADIFIGLSAPKVLESEMVKSMSKDPIIFALANPEPEIIPSLAKEAGALIVATGRSDFPNQINNALVFPGVFRGAIDNNVKLIDNKILIRVAEKLATLTKDLNCDSIIPNIFDKGVVKAVSNEVY